MLLRADAESCVGTARLAGRTDEGFVVLVTEHDRTGKGALIRAWGRFRCFGDCNGC